MYTPKHFAFPEGATAELHDLIEAEPFGILVTAGDGSSDPTSGLQAVHLPLLLDRGRGPFGTLAGHVARANPIWQLLADRNDVLIVLPGPHAYISPDWYVTSGLVPTWNYVAIHAYGVPAVIHDDARIAAHLKLLSATSERALAPKQPWSTDRVAPRTHAALVRQVVGIEVQVSRLEGKRKLNQNRSAADRSGVVDALEIGSHTGGQAIAAAMRVMSDD